MKQIEKNFDCVAMKNAIQERLVIRRKGMNAAEFMADVEQSLAHSNAPIARFWRQINTDKRPQSRGRITVGR